VRVRLAPERKRDSEGNVALALELGPQAAMVVLDPLRREVLALVGGYGYRLGGFDRSQRAHRQPGSAFKPFIYAAAIDSKRYTAASVVNDSPEVFKLWKPQNHDKDNFRGPVACAWPWPIPSTPWPSSCSRMWHSVGARDGRARWASICRPREAGPVVGARHGHRHAHRSGQRLRHLRGWRPIGDTRLVTAFGNELNPAPELQQSIRPETAYITVSLMRSVVESGTARSAAPKLKRPAAGKTGTTDEDRDAWFVGFTPELLAGGLGRLRRAPRARPGRRRRAHRPAHLDRIHDQGPGRRARERLRPAPGVVVARIDPATGLLPAPGSEGIEEFFLDGTAPTESAAAPGEEATPDQMLLEGHGWARTKPPRSSPARW
jgi:penicillin-binding protein 1A